MKTFNHVGNDLKDLKTENIEGKRYYVTPKGNKYVSITSLLGNLSKQSIIEWRRRVGEAEANKIRSPPKIDICIKFYRVSDFMATRSTPLLSVSFGLKELRHCPLW